MAVIPYPRFVTTYRELSKASRNPNKSEMSVRIYHHKLRNIPEERRYCLLEGGSLKSRFSHLLDAFDSSLTLYKTTQKLGGTVFISCPNLI
jgi:hypothetical protein